MRTTGTVRSNVARSWMVDGECTGSPEGCVEVRFTDLRESGRVEIELHMSPAEALMFRSALESAVKETLGLP